METQISEPEAETLIRRGHTCNQIPRSELLKDIDSRLHGTYNVTQDAVELNRARILERIPK